MKDDTKIAFLSVISLLSTLVLLLTFYWSLFVIYPATQKFTLSVTMNTIGEFWLEFGFLHIVVAIVIYWMVKAFIRIWRR